MSPSAAISTSARERTPQLVLRFAVFTALGLALAAAVIVVVVRQESTLQSQRQALERTQFATEALLKHELQPSDLEAQPSAKRRRVLDRLFETRVLLEGIQNVTLYRKNGDVVYSAQVGTLPRPLPARFLREALRGVTVSEVSGNGRERTLRTYVPIAVGPPRTTGVAAFELGYGPIEVAARRSSWLIAGVLEALLLLLFLILAPALARVTSRIRRHVDELEHAATHDELTGLPNRLGFRRSAQELLASGSSSAALLLVDLDGFSEINDGLGSTSGDTLLTELGERLRSELVECEVFARLGEDEFGVLIRDGTAAEIAAAAERIERALIEPFVIDGVRIAVTVSVGAAMLSEHDIDLATALRRAGAALTSAKEAGRSKLQIYDASYQASDSSRVALTAELREALQVGQLVVHYQPQADLATYAVRGVEALVRWEHPERGLLNAGMFIAQAERGGLTTQLRSYVLETSARQWQEWATLGINLELAVNVSTVDMLDASLPDEIADLLERYRIPPWNLILEITERTMIGDERRSAQVIDALSRIGIRLAIDDFGIGESSLASLRRFRIQQVKLDRSLMADVPGDPAAEAIVGASIEIAHAIGATVVAEGIETHDQWRFASAFGCDVAQGYLIGRAVTGDEITERVLTAPIVRGNVAA
jgi:diguanylate cyclase (GGDEF)-like protein